MEHEGDSGINCDWCAWNGLLGLGKGTGGVENQRKNVDHPDYSIVKIDLKTEKRLDRSEY